MRNIALGAFDQGKAHTVSGYLFTLGTFALAAIGTQIRVLFTRCRMR